MKEYKNVTAAEQRITDLVAEKGLENGIAVYLQNVAENLTDGKLPGEWTPENAAASIVKTAESYVNNRDDQLATGLVMTAEDVRVKIAEKLLDMTTEQALDYLACLQLTYKYFAPGVVAGVTAEDLEAEYEALLANADGKDPQQLLDEMMDVLNVEQTNRFLDAAEDLEDSTAEATIEKLRADYATVQSASIRGAAIYSEAVQGNMAQIDLLADPGEVTAKAAAYTDAVAVAVKADNGEITEEEGKTMLGVIGTCLAIALAVALWVLMISACADLGALVGGAVMKIKFLKAYASLADSIVFAACAWMITSQFGDHYDAIRKWLLRAKMALNKHLDANRTKMHNSNKNTEFA